MITITLCTIIFLISYFSFSKSELFNRLSFHPYSVIYYQQWDRFIGHIFIHADWTHLIFNLYTLFSFGTILENVLIDSSILNALHPGSQSWSPMVGQVILLILFFVGGIVAALPAFIKHKNQIGYQSVGASGAISALLMAFMILFPQSEIAFFMILPMPSWVGALVFLGLEHYLSKKSQSNIAHDAHLWGAIAGIAIISCWNYEFTLDFIFYVFHDIQSWIK